MKKRALRLFSLLLLTVILCSCGGDPVRKPTDSTDLTAQQTVVIDLMMDQTDRRPKNRRKRSRHRFRIVEETTATASPIAQTMPVEPTPDDSK